MVKAWNAFADSRGNGVGGITFAPLQRCRGMHRTRSRDRGTSTNPIPLVPALASKFASYPETDGLFPPKIRPPFASRNSRAAVRDRAAKLQWLMRFPALPHM